MSNLLCTGIFPIVARMYGIAVVLSSRNCESGGTRYSPKDLGCVLYEPGKASSVAYRSSLGYNKLWIDIYPYTDFIYKICLGTFPSLGTLVTNSSSNRNTVHSSLSPVATWAQWSVHRWIYRPSRSSGQ
jgi:hypothetical protein